MIRLLSLILLLSCSLSSYALDLSSEWTTSTFIKQLTFSCKQNKEYLCDDLCGDYNKCVIKENYCRNCGGDNLYLKSLFKEVGKIYKNTGVSVDYGEFIQFIKGGDFVSISSKSIYNLVDKFNSKALKERFRSLCEMPTAYPIVFLEVNKVSRLPKRVRYVTCQGDNFDESDIFQMHRVYEVTVND